jgi:predicted permease
MPENNPTTVSRAEFYSTVSLLFLMPALLVLVYGNFPETLLRMAVAILIFVTMIGMSVTFSIMAIRERGRQGKENKPGV